jgi:hypothetical protein
MKHLRRCVFVIVTCAFIAGVISGAIAMYGLRGLPQDAYASDWTAIFIIEHLKATEGTWPRNWADLQDEFDRMAEPSHYAWSFDELQQRVNVQFHLTSQQVRDADPPVEAIRLTSGRHVSYDGDPNVNVREYLRTTRGGTESIRRK